MKTEQELANELDAFLTAQLKGRPAPPPSDSQAEARLATALFDLATEAEPDPVFLSGLEAHLARAASRQRSQKKAPERPSFWQQILTTVEESLTMRRTVFALGTIVALIIVGFFAVKLLLPNDGIEPGVFANLPTADSEAVVTPESEAETAVNEAAPQAASDTANLPLLPSLSAGGGGSGGFGGGGGGGEIASSVPVTDANGDLIFLPHDPLSGTVYLLNTTLPTEPQFATVYEQPGENSITLEEVRDFATRFRMGDEVYTQYYPAPEPAPGEETWTPPTFYFMFDGPRTLSVWGTSLQYYDQSAAPDFQTELMAYEQAVPIAEAFLRERGLLDFDYQLVAPQYSGNEVNFHRVVNGRLVNIAEYTVNVTVDGQILSVYYNPLNKLQTLGDYPLRSAEAAWQELLSEGIDYQTRYYYTYPGPGYEFPAEPAVGDDGYKYWQRIYTDGEALVLYTSPTVYQPVDSSATPYIQTEQFILSGSDDILRAIADQVGQQIQITGTIQRVNGVLTLAATDWQPIEFIDYQYQPGTIRHSDGQTLFDADSGETFLIPDAPTDVADGERVNVNGWSLEPGEPYRVFNWQGMDRIIDFEPFPGEISIDPAIQEPYRIGEVDITSAELIYAYIAFVGEARTDVQIFLQPAWRFKGTTDNNEIIEFVVQAVTDEFVNGSGQ